MYRADSPQQRRLASSFVDWGIPTADSIIQVKKAVPDLLIFASGGLRSGLDIAKSIALGASAGGMAGPFLKAAAQSVDHVIDLISETTNQIRITMFGAGVDSIKKLQKMKLIKKIQ